MVYPIYVYGQPVLRKVAVEIDKNYPKLNEFIQNMFDTMDKTDGVGLAAPQVGESIRLFVTDGAAFEKDDANMANFRKVYINAQIIERSGTDEVFNEGCLSLPTLREDVIRKSTIRITYYDQDFNFFNEVYDGTKARIIQHEYDHIDGKMFIDHLSPLRKRIIKRKLANISRGEVDIAYKIKVVKQ
jgi:peptide deformylase